MTPVVSVTATPVEVVSPSRLPEPKVCPPNRGCTLVSREAVGDAVQPAAARVQARRRLIERVFIVLSALSGGWGERRVHGGSVAWKQWAPRSKIKLTLQLRPLVHRPPVRSCSQL